MPIAQELVDVLRAEAPSIRPLVLTSERGAGRLELCRANGAAAVVAKAASERELVHDLRVVFDCGAIWDRRVELV
jgi:DNA-binding NarL/FixJ family response regulator